MLPGPYFIAFDKSMKILFARTANINWLLDTPARFHREQIKISSAALSLLYNAAGCGGASLRLPFLETVNRLDEAEREDRKRGLV